MKIKAQEECWRISEKGNIWCTLNVFFLNPQMTETVSRYPFLPTHQGRQMAWKVPLHPLLPHPPLLPCLGPLHPSLLPPLFPSLPPEAAARPRPSSCQRLSFPPLQLHLLLGWLEPEWASASGGRKRSYKTIPTSYGHSQRTWRWGEDREALIVSTKCLSRAHEHAQGDNALTASMQSEQYSH